MIFLTVSSAAHENGTSIQLSKYQESFEQTKDLEQSKSCSGNYPGYPKSRAFRKALVKLYLYQNRPDDAEKELRSFGRCKSNGYWIGNGT